MQPEDRPIGYWLRELDRRIEETFTARLAGAGLQRRHWQVLNGLGPGDPFWGPGERPYHDILDDLVRRGWSGPDGTRTPDGEAARAAIAADAGAVRRRVAQGVPAEDYLTTVRTLARMTANLSG